MFAQVCPQLVDRRISGSFYLVQELATCTSGKIYSMSAVKAIGPSLNLNTVPMNPELLSGRVRLTTCHLGIHFCCGASNRANFSRLNWVHYHFFSETFFNLRYTEDLLESFSTFINSIKWNYVSLCYNHSLYFHMNLTVAKTPRAGAPFRFSFIFRRTFSVFRSFAPCMPAILCVTSVQLLLNALFDESYRWSIHYSGN